MEKQHKIMARHNQVQMEQLFIQNAFQAMKVYSVELVIQDILSKITHTQIAFHAKINLTSQNM